MKTFIILKEHGIDLLTPLLGKPVVWYMVRSLATAGIKDVSLLGDFDCNRTIEELKALFAGDDFSLDTDRNVLTALKQTPDESDVLILSGDMPFLPVQTINQVRDFYLQSNRQSVTCAIHLPGKHAYDRVFDNDGILTAIIDKHDKWLPARLKRRIEYANAGIYAFKGDMLKNGIKLLEEKSSRESFNITAVPNILCESGTKVLVCHLTANATDFKRVTTQRQLADATERKRKIINAKHMDAGVRMIDPATVYIDAEVEVGAGSVIYPGVILEGKCVIGENAVLGPGTHITDSFVDAGCKVRQSVVIDTKIGKDTTVGPFAYLRAGASVGNSCRIGSFVEVKNSSMGDSTNMAHLAYIGDADVGSNVNYSCGAITCNYDGKHKHRTVIEDGAFIGSNSNLIAPLRIQKNAYVAAGSTITDDVSENALAIARQRQTEKPGWNKK